MNYLNFYTGKEFEAHEFLGAHVDENGVLFRVYAPSASHVAVIGEFNGWTDTDMKPIHDGQFYECRIEDARPGQMYKYRIYRPDGGSLDHADPYAFYSEKRPGTASIIYDMKQYQFGDQEFMSKRGDFKNRPLNIYEINLGSWRRKDGGEHDSDWQVPADASFGWFSYEETADLLIPYLKENHYNCVELMPLNEYPADESWGYQATGFFSATSRYGDPDGLRAFVDKLHQNGIAVILDVITVHFAKNDYSLMNFDGTALYEYPNEAVGYSEWGSCNFMHSRGDVRSFLNSASEFWLSCFHFDGLRFDAIGNLIYWQGDQGRGENRDALQFLRTMNQGLHERHPYVMLIAEDSTAYPGVTKNVSDGGLGFDYKWDLGWMNDTLSYFQEWPERRPSVYHKLTFSMQYFYNEKYLLPLSHDEVVHGKATILQKMYGDYEGKFPQARALYLYMYTHPGKKLNFMGNEVGQLREWDEKREQDWFITRYPLHDSFHRFMIDLNVLYETHPSLWQYDYDRKGFEWVDANEEIKNVYVFRRLSDDESILCIFNFSDVPQTYDLQTGSPSSWTRTFRNTPARVWKKRCSPSASALRRPSRSIFLRSAAGAIWRQKAQQNPRTPRWHLKTGGEVNAGNRFQQCSA